MSTTFPGAGSDEMVHESSWDEFSSAGLLWWVNRVLHLCGWCIVVEKDPEGQVTRAYPAYTSFRGFSADCETRGFQALTKHLKDNMDDLERDVAS